MVIVVGICPRNGQRPGFNVMKIDKKTLAPKDLTLTVLDVNKTISENYSSPPKLDDIPIHHVDYSKDFKFKDLTPSSISKTLNHILSGEGGPKLYNKYMISKIGFPNLEPENKIQIESIA